MNRVVFRERPPRPSRGSNHFRSVVLSCSSLTANSGLVGCLGSSDVDSDRGIYPGSCPSKSPTSPDNQDVMLRSAASSAVWGADPRARCAGLVLARFGSSCCLLLLLGGPPLRQVVIASCMPHSGRPPCRARSSAVSASQLVTRSCVAILGPERCFVAATAWRSAGTAQTRKRLASPFAVGALSPWDKTRWRPSRDLRAACQTSCVPEDTIRCAGAAGRARAGGSC